MKSANVIKYIRSPLSVNYREPLLKYVAFHLDAAALVNRRRLIFLTFAALIAAAAIPVIYKIAIGWHEVFFVDASQHTSLEIFCGLISGIIAFILTWEYQASGKRNILWLVLAFFSISILDIFHAFSDFDHNAFVWFHSSSAFFGSVFFAGSVFLNGKIDTAPSHYWTRICTVASGIGGIILFAVASLKLNIEIPSVLSIKLPHTMSAVEVQGYFSTFIYAINFISGMFYLFAGIIFLKGFIKTGDVIYMIFSTAALLFFESEFLFAFSKLWDPLWWYWHIIKALIFSGLLIGLAVGFIHTVYRLHGSRIKLANYLQEIETKNIEIRDAYDRLKETQKYLKESEKLASLGKMAAMVAHEIRNPLGAISNSLGALARHSALGSDDLELIGIVEKEVDRLNTITEDFLSFSRPSLLRRQQTDVHRLIDETISMLQSDAGCSGVRICRSFAPKLPMIQLDRDKFRQILLNLFINAKQAMPAGGEISAATRFKPSEDEVEITIADTGEGMSEEVLSKVFQPFFTTKSSGLGLGLNIVNKIVKEHGGYMLLSSTPGKGTHIQLNFPVAGETAEAAPESGVPSLENTELQGE